MGKYDPLRTFLQDQPGERVPVTFAEIERLIGSPLPNSKRYPAWWSNNPSNNVMTKVWLDAGYVTEQVDTEAGRLVFRRAAQGAPSRTQPRTGPFPGFGCMQGTLHISADLDLTGPADPDWSKVFG